MFVRSALLALLLASVSGAQIRGARQLTACNCQTTFCQHDAAPSLCYGYQIPSKKSCFAGTTNVCEDEEPTVCDCSSPTPCMHDNDGTCLKENSLGDCPAGSTKLCETQLVCPPPPAFGVCVEQCSGDGDCQAGKLCCSNGCGHECMDGV